MAVLAISRDLLADFARLEKRSRNKVLELADMFQRMTAQELRSSKGIHLEQHVHQRDPRARTIRIDANHRGVVFDAGDESTYVLTHIGTHDDVDDWMANNRFRVNEATGALEILNIAAVNAEVDRIQPPSDGSPRLFAHRRDRDFVQLGIDADLIPALRAFTNEDQLQGLLAVLPQPQADTLILLTGDEPTDTIYGEIAGSIDRDQIDPDDVAAALAAPASHAMFHVVADEDELAAMLAQPLALWRTYLHHSQHDAAYRPRYSGPARITGGPGTGKTVVAMHRAKALAEAIDDRNGQPILFTTFTRNLAQAIEKDLRMLGGADLLDVVEVLNVDRLAYRIVQDSEDATPRIADDTAQVWQEVIDDLDVEFRPEFLAQEWEQVVLAQAIRSRDEYFSAPRSGRGVRLDRRRRATAWRAFEEFERRLIEHGARTHLQLADAAAGYLRARTVRPYRHVIVDEAQDLHETQWRLLREAVGAGPNDLFIVGDSHQRIYDRKTSLSKVGIEVRGRSRRLRINYRTTHEILRWSLAVLGEGSFDDLDEGVESSNFAGYHSFLHGPMPEVSGHRARKEQLDALADRVRGWIADGVAAEDIGVTARTTASLGSAEHALTSAGIEVERLAGDRAIGAGVRTGTMHRFKGLEFRCVAVVDVDGDSLPLPAALTPHSVDEAQHRADVRRERCLLYVACTRAREYLWVGWSGRPSRFLDQPAEDGTSGAPEGDGR